VRLLILLIILLYNTLDCPCNKVHHPYRLKTIQSNKQVSGIVKRVSKELDGDIHIRLKINNDTLLTKNNFKHEDSCLVLEIVCATKSIFSICKGYDNQIKIPNVGDSIYVEGPYIYDKIHGINEIHPIIKLNILKKALF
jgi:hypothetical protein